MIRSPDWMAGYGADRGSGIVATVTARPRRTRHPRGRTLIHLGPLRITAAASAARHKCSQLFLPAAHPDAAAPFPQFADDIARHKIRFLHHPSAHRCADVPPEHSPMTYTTLIAATELQALIASGQPLMVFDCSFDLTSPSAGAQHLRRPTFPVPCMPTWIRT